MNQNVIKVILNSAPSFCCINDAYKETLTITANSIEYTCTPISESNSNPSTYWSYHTNSSNFKVKYNLVAKLAINALNNDLELLSLSVCDGDEIGVEVIYSDGSSLSNYYFGSIEQLGILPSEISTMIPKCEDIPPIITIYDELLEDENKEQT